MFQGEIRSVSPNAHLLIGEMPAPQKLDGSFWEGTGLSIAAHALVLGILIYGATHARQVVQAANTVTENFNLEFFVRPGVGSKGGGGGGSEKSDLARKAELAPARPRDLNPTLNPADTPHPLDMKIPVVIAEAMQTVPGALAQIDTTSVGPGSGPGAAGGRGPGSGPGEGPGVGNGRLGGFGADTFQAGNDVTSPQLIKDVKPKYTVDAMRAKLQGVVEMEAVVLRDGSIDPGRIRITRSLDGRLGLDEAAIVALEQWRFRPGTYKGQPVSVRIKVELTFTLR